MRKNEKILDRSGVAAGKPFQNHRPQLRNAARAQRKNHVPISGDSSHRTHRIGERTAYSALRPPFSRIVLAKTSPLIPSIGFSLAA